MHFTGLLYRALNPVWSCEPLSGKGAARFGGRFNCSGRPALYTSLAPETALREANQVGTLQPTTLVAYQADIGPLLDGRDTAALQPFGMAPEELADPSWRDRMFSGRPVPTQDLAEAAIAQGFVGIVVPSYARGAPAEAINLVLWDWAKRITFVDDDDRLGLRAP
ncbi:RES family NAD+ phosphorylase [Novosphingobium cyanobacteriorum]|uniref:RES domain-containing protein n=1 Tax=Novosphingobium cyanobacteriorum TaxID=3024215 RepID=A0ABT6CID3_9SPHN|nr:RES domain-containing protein [Novosphingobium cyanobacteriorum]MDF8333680.1 RES domain-containing protein [Novosphingobium cyanobacteriorum]